MSEKELSESGKIFALSMVLLNCLILVTVFSILWLAQLFLDQSDQLNVLLQGFRA